MEIARGQISLRTAALVAGFTTLVMVVCAPFAEIYAYPKLVIAGNAAETFKNIGSHQTLFAMLIMGYTITFIGDVVTAWALYILLKPVNTHLSALAALLRLVFAVACIVTVFNLIDVFRMVTEHSYASIFNQSQLEAQVMHSLNTFRYGFHFASVFFGIYLCLLGCLVWRSGYIPWILGLLLVINGLGYFISSLQPYLFPSFNTGFTMYTFYGELIFTFWLLVKGWKLKEIPGF